MGVCLMPQYLYGYIIIIMENDENVRLQPLVLFFNSYLKGSNLDAQKDYSSVQEFNLECPVVLKLAQITLRCK